MDLKRFVMPDGTLTPIEFSDCPFVPRRLFWIQDVPLGAKRANHAHKECHQFIFMIEGDLNATLHYKDGSDEVIKLEVGSTLYVPNMTFLVLYDISPDAIIGVLASHPYDVNDYIDDYWGEFKPLCQES